MFFHNILLIFNEIICDKIFFIVNPDIFYFHYLHRNPINENL